MEVILIKKQGGYSDEDSPKYNKTKNYKKRGDVKRVIKYIMRKQKRLNLNIYGSVNMIETSPNKMSQEMHMIKKIYDQKDSYQIKHICLTIGDEPFTKLNRRKFIKLFERTLGCFHGAQAIYALHEQTKVKHIHVAFNTVNIYGKRLDLSDNALAEFGNNFKKVFGKYYSHTEQLNLILYF